MLPSVTASNWSVDRKLSEWEPGTKPLVDLILMNVLFLFPEVLHL